MKTTLIIILLVITFIGCEIEYYNDNDIYIRVEYPGEFYIFLSNETELGDNYVCVFYGNNSYGIKENDFIGMTRELNNIRIECVKVYGEDYPDNGDLAVEMFYGQDLLVKDVAEKGIQEAIIVYNF